MVSRTKGLLAVALLSLGTGLFFPTRALAAGQPYSLTTSPVFLDLPIKPGSSSTNTLQVMNNSSQPVTISVQLQIFSADGDTGEASIHKAPASDQSPSWVHFSPSTFVAQPSVWSSVKMSIDIPTTAQLGYYYAVLFKPVVPNQTLNSVGSVIKGSNAILVLVDTESANEKRQIEVSDFSVTKGLYEYLPVTFNIGVKNSGNIFVAPTGDIFISRNSNLTDTIATVPVNSGFGNVLPDSVRDFTNSWTAGFPVFQPKVVDGQPVLSKGKPVEQLQWDFSKLNQLRIGKYYAQLALVYDNGRVDIPITSEVSFWVIPWKIFLILFVLFLLLIVGFWSIGRNLVRRIRKFHKKK